MTSHPTDPELLRPEHYPHLPLEGEPWQWFETACRDFDIPLNESHHAVLEALYSHLVGVNAWLNLTRLTEPEQYLKFHILDSLTALPFVEELSDPGDLCVDIGSGGGYPGLPLMTWLPDRRWLLVDSRQKKVAFLQEAIRLTPCQHAAAAAFRGREIRSARPAAAGHCRLVVARALGPAQQILVETAEMLQHEGWLLLLKGPAFARDERDAALETAVGLGFEMMQEMALSLDEDDPERLLVLFQKRETPRPHRQRGRSTAGRGGTRPARSRPDQTPGGRTRP